MEERVSKEKVMEEVGQVIDGRKEKKHVWIIYYCHFPHIYQFIESHPPFR